MSGPAVICGGIRASDCPSCQAMFAWSSTVSAGSTCWPFWPWLSWQSSAREGSRRDFLLVVRVLVLRDDPWRSLD
eukprot:12247331-Alexandrium_andersonii.AAC.1